MSVVEEQKRLCEQYQVPYFPAPLELKIGIALNVQDGIEPINGLRHPPEGDTTGWYIWAGEELSEAPDYFQPLHVEHLSEWCPLILKYLGLPPGWRFLSTKDYEDVWYDEKLLKI